MDWESAQERKCESLVQRLAASCRLGILVYHPSLSSHLVPDWTYASASGIKRYATPSHLISTPFPSDSARPISTKIIIHHSAYSSHVDNSPSTTSFGSCAALIHLVQLSKSFRSLQTDHMSRESHSQSPPSSPLLQYSNTSRRRTTTNIFQDSICPGRGQDPPCT